MDRDLFIKQVKKDFQWLINLGYEFVHIETSIYFEKKSQDEAYAISFSWAEYNRFLIQNITAFKRFNKIEKCLNSVNNNALDYTIRELWNGEIPSDFEVVKNENHFINSFFIEDYSQIKLFSQMIEDFFINEVKSFFSKYQDLKNIIDEMNLLPSETKASMIVNTNNSTFMRIMAIKYFVNPQDGIEFYDETVKELAPLKNQRTFSLILDNLAKLKNELSQSV
ncbi:hypothetical protein [Aquimarina sp. AU119]|uniref:hypothetical protein n=1 Tax=Aquimarina sp. AU119 TaxID=2108528 RepID=UPI000D691B00|nr:hypothetical protein [Aquimarina sp. AU119]